MPPAGLSTRYRPMRAREVGESHRAVTPLELLFDLTYVAAVSQLAARLAHAIVTGHAASSVGPYLMVFFAIWWGWMNFTWFASAYDCDDTPYRVAVLVQMAGALVLSAGVGDAFSRGSYEVIALGYLMMRIGLVGLWVRAALQDAARRRTASRYAGGIALLEVGWLSWLWLPVDAGPPGFVLLAVAELLVPIWAERAEPTTWHPFHIAERYALFTIILLGEGIFAATRAVSAAVDDGAGSGFVAFSVASLVIVAAIWWRSFAAPAGAALAARRRSSFVWGYGHYPLFAALAAIGAGLEVLALAGEHVGTVAPETAVAAVAVPMGVVVLLQDVLRISDRGRVGRPHASTLGALALLAGVVMLAPHSGSAIGALLLALTLVALVAVESRRPSRAARPGAAPAVTDALDDRSGVV